MGRCAKIVATIGPATHDEQMIAQLIETGVNVARLNFSHGSHEDHAAVFNRIRKISGQMGRPLGILQDLQGPKIRTGELENGQVELTPGQQLTLTSEPVIGNDKVIPVDFPHLADSVRPGGRILLDDGNLELAVIAIHDHEVKTNVVLGGTLKPHKGVNLPGAKLDIPGFTSKDEADLAFGMQLGVDFVAVSFVRSARDIEVVRHAIARLSPERARTPIIAKMERPEAIDNLEEIVSVADGVMVARGDLGVELSPEAVPIAQKCIIEAANRHAKLVITATQMLDSMIRSPRPTRAEASDVANAIFDGSDALMLSGETAAGLYPIQSVKMMDVIIQEAEVHREQWGHPATAADPDSGSDDTFFMTRAARELAHDRNVAAIAVFTKSGRSALLMSKTRPGIPILAFTPNASTYQLMTLYWGVHPYLVPDVETIEAMIEAVEQAIINFTSIRPGQQVVLVCGYPVLQVRPTNMALLHTIGE